MRTTQQTWKLCSKYLDKFMESDGKGWETVYRKKGKIVKRAPVIDYKKEIELII
jgi:hypothetical protein